MPKDQKIVAMPTGERIAFPGTMQDSEINNVLTNYIPGAGMAPPNPIHPLPKEIQPVQSYGNYGGKFNPSMVPANIEQAGIAHDVRESKLTGAESRANQSPTPMTNAVNIMAPVTAARQVVGAKLGGYAGDKLKPGGTGEALGGLLGGLLSGSAGEPDTVRRGTQSALGIGTNFIKEGAERLGDEHASIIGEQQSKINQAKTAEPQAFAEAEAKHKQRLETVQKANAEAESGFNQRQQHVELANQNAQELSSRLPDLHKAAKAEASAAYGPQPKGTYEADEIKNLIEDTAKQKLQGNTQMPTAVTKVLKDIDQPPQTLLDQASVFKGGGKSMRGAATLDDLPPAARAKFYQQNPDVERMPEDAPATGKTPPLDAQRIHGFMSELGRAAQSGSLSGDEASAINATRTALEGRLRKLYENENRLGDFQNGQAKWKQMANTFENSSSPAKGGSPIAQALQTKDPVTGKLRPDYVQSYLTGDKSFKIAQEHLNRYKDLGAPTEALEQMKSHSDAADALPKKVTTKPEPSGPDYPNFTKWGNLPKLPEGQTLGEFDPIEARKVALKQKSRQLNSGSGMATARDVSGLAGLAQGNPLALKYGLLRRGLASGLDRAGLTEWLSKPTPEEMEMAKEIPAKKIALKKASGK